MNDCRNYWWRHFLYINNYYNDSECMVHSWYLATDTQLYIMAVILYLSCRTARSQKIVLTLLILGGIGIPAAHVYFQDLDGVLIVSPEAIVSIFQNDPHFNIIYKAGHTNLVGYSIGVAMGYLVYNCQKKEISLKNYQMWPFYSLYWLTFPMCILCCYSGAIFYARAPVQSIYIRTLFGACLKPLFALFVAAITMGLIFKYEGFYRGILESHIWTVPSRLSYSAYLLHIPLVRIHMSFQNTTVRTSTISAAETCLGLMLGAFIAAVIFYLLVEAPVTNIIKECLSKPKSVTEEKTKDIEETSTDISKKCFEL